MLRHYENECTFHIVECLRCGEGVLHRELATHSMAGCRAGVSSARAENTSSVSGALTLQDVRNALDEVKTLLRDANHEQLLLAIESKMNELTEQVRNQESRLGEIAGEVAASVKTVVAQIATPVSSTVWKSQDSRRNPAQEAGTSSPSCSQRMLMPRKPDPFSRLPQGVLQDMRKTSSQDYPRHAIVYRDPVNVKCHLSLTAALSTTRTWREVLGGVKYTLRLEKCGRDTLLQERPIHIAEITVLHAMDAYFTVEVYTDSVFLFTRIKFHGMVGGSRCSAPSIEVKMHSWTLGHMDSVFSCEDRWDCEHNRDLWVHRQRSFFSKLDSLIKDGYLRFGKLELEIELSRNEYSQSGPSSC
ncbi:hypothetical protein MTO96_040723 [Rhipicephalus appendiculatus]